jgi:transglutaminase-like putative cysteine protease
MKDVLIQRPLSSALLYAGSLLMVLASAPHAGNLNPKVSAAFILFVLLRFLFWPRPGKSAPAWLMVLLLAISVVLVLYQADLSEGRQFGVTLLVLMAGMKLLEMKTRRDLYVLVFLGYFVLVTLFLFYQTPALTGYVLLVSTGFTALLIGNNLAADELPVRILARKAALMVVTSIPVMALLFVLFPRLDAPLWSLNLGSSSGTTGMSDSIRMGSISDLSQSREIAFRVRFKNIVPAPTQRYWRGMVLWHYDGRNWTRGKAHLSRTAFKAAGPVIEYEVTMEPTNRHWLFPLDHALRPARGILMNSDGEMGIPQPIKQRFTWKGQSALHIEGEHLSNREWQLGLQLPDTISRRTQQLASSLRGKNNRDEEVVQAALHHFNQKPFVYTLQPPLLGEHPVDQFLFDTRKGFCEHYATSFVTLMRLADIPARVVVGYQGGEINPLGGHLVIRQSDAHAWAEVWLEGKGWTRVDPTAAVAPERIEYPIATNDYADGSPITFNLGRTGGLMSGLLNNMRWLRDNMQLKWHYWVVGFNSQRQQNLLQKIGLPRLDGYRLGLAAILGTLGLAGLIFVLGMWPGRSSRDPLTKSYRHFIGKLEKAGLDIPPATGPEDLGRLATRAFPHRGTDIQAIIGQYIALRYGPNPQQNITAAFRSRVRRFRI